MQQRTDPFFRLGVRAPHTGHVAAALLRRENIHWLHLLFMTSNPFEIIIADARHVGKDSLVQVEHDRAF